MSRKKSKPQLARLDAWMPKALNDPECVACYLQNDSPYPLTFKSTLEVRYPMLIEAKGFVEFTLEPKEKRLVPHTYFDILPHDVERKVTRIGIGRDHPPVEFYYEIRRPGTPKAGAGDPHSPAEGSDTQP